MIKKILTFGFGILLVFTLLVGVSGFSYDEDDSGNPFYEADAKIKVPSMNIKDLITLQPSVEPISPEVGMIYFDSGSKRLKLYDGSGWYALALEKVSSVSKKQVKETVERKSEVQGCVASTECGDWGDCINNYESMICVTTEEDCNKYEDTETRDCISDFVLESSAKESHDVVETEEETTKETEATGEDEETTGEAEEETEEVEEEIEETEEIPEELFDITFDLEEHILSESDKLVIWITLQNFGKRYVPARLIYSITDIEGVEVYRKFEEVRVYTDESIIHQFDDLVLNEGNYVLTMRVEYAGIVEEFSDDFSIEKGIFGVIKRFFSGLF